MHAAHHAPLPPCRRPCMTILYTDPLFLRHETGRHPERPDRLRAVPARLEQSGLPARCSSAPWTPLEPDEVARLHDPDMVERVHLLAQGGGGRLDPDTVVSP